MYSGDSNYAASTGAPGFSLKVTGVDSMTTVTASSTSMLVGKKLSFSVSVAGQPGTTTPTGMVRLLIQGTDASDSISVNVSLANGSATTPFLDFRDTWGLYRNCELPGRCGLLSFEFNPVLHR